MKTSLLLITAAILMFGVAGLAQHQPTAPKPVEAKLEWSVKVDKATVTVKSETPINLGQARQICRQAWQQLR